MSLPEFTLKDDFPPVDYAQWRALAEADLKGAAFEQKLVTHSYEGIDIQPLYTRRERIGEGDVFGFAGLPPFVRGSRPEGLVLSGWDLRQEHAHPDLAITNRAILDDLAGGVTSLTLRLNRAARDGLDPDAPGAAEQDDGDGIMCHHVDDMDAVLSGVDVEGAAIALDAGAAFLPAAAMLAALWQRRKVSWAQAHGAFNADPLAALARDGHLPCEAGPGLSLVGDIARWTAKNCPNVTAVGVDTGVYHDAGATAAQDIAFAIAAGVEYLRAMTNAGLSIEDAARQILFNFSLGTHHFLAIAKLRAARWLWWRVLEACGVPASVGGMRMCARTSRRVLTKRDPYVNLLRNAVGVFAAGLGGAETITSLPLDALIGLPDEFSRRVARNTLLILQEEVHLHRVIDPAGGSWFLDWLTNQIAEKGWQIFQQVEGQGGMLRALQDNWVAAQIESAFAPRAKDIARRKEGITGVSEFPDVREETVRHAAPDWRALRDSAARRVAAARRESEALAQLTLSNEKMAVAVTAAANGASIGQMATALGFHRSSTEIAPLEFRGFAEPFEELRRASDAWHTTHGRRPTVFLANLGPVAHHTARTNYSKNFFEAGGFEVVSSEPLADASAASKAFSSSDASIAVICSSDKLYPELVPPVARELKAAGARSIVLAGNPGLNEQVWRDAGVDRFIYVKCDVLATLREMLEEEGVLEPASAGG